MILIAINLTALFWGLLRKAPKVPGMSAFSMFPSYGNKSNNRFSLHVRELSMIFVIIIHLYKRTLICI